MNGAVVILGAMTDLWVDVNACAPIRVTVHGDGPVSDADATPERQTVCWICVTSWPCDAFREGRLNVVQLAAVRQQGERT